MQSHEEADCPQRVDVSTLLDLEPVYMHGCPDKAVVISSAQFSDDGRHRYLLKRFWDLTLPPATFLMLNPSTADARADDPTIRRCRGFATDMGCGGLVVVNLYAYRATDPSALFGPGLTDEDRIGPDNDHYLTEAALQARRADAPLIGAWGVLGRPERVKAVLELPGMDRITALAVTASGMPGHPLYLKADLRPKPWTAPASPTSTSKA